MAEERRNVTHQGGDDMPIVEEDLKCPICISTLVDPFITPCGHAFCHACVKTHLEHAPTCPNCSSPLTQDRLYPSFLLSKVGSIVSCCVESWVWLFCGFVRSNWL